MPILTVRSITAVRILLWLNSTHHGLIVLRTIGVALAQYLALALKSLSINICINWHALIYLPVALSAAFDCQKLGQVVIVGRGWLIGIQIGAHRNAF